MSMLKLADLVFRGAEESPPKVTIHIPRTPVMESSPAIPSPLSGSKAGLKSKRLKIPMSMKVPGTQSPLSTPSGKIKIPSTPPVQSEDGVSRRPPPSLPPPTSISPSRPASSQTRMAQRKDVAFATPKPKPKPKTGSPKKPKPVQAQSSGMSANDYRASRSALKKIQSNKHARLFSQPVDPVRDNAPKSVAAILQPVAFFDSRF